MKTKILISAIILFLLVGCQTKKEFTDADKEKVLQELKVESNKMWALFNSNFNDESCSKMIEFLDKDAEKLWQTEPVLSSFNFSLIKNYNDWESFFRDLFTQQLGNEFNFIESHYLVLSDIYVFEVVVADYHVLSKDGEKFGPFQMVNNIIWRKKDGVWKVSYGQQTYAKKKVD